MQLFTYIKYSQLQFNLEPSSYQSSMQKRGHKNKICMVRTFELNGMKKDMFATNQIHHSREISSYQLLSIGGTKDFFLFSAKDWLKTKATTVVEWPAQSPDLYATETLWGDFERLYSQETHLKECRK